MKSKIWAHRGASAYAPENTVPAFELAKEQGADGIELDVQMSRDGKLVVIHDEKLERVCNCSGYVKEYTLQELKKFNCGKNFPSFGKASIPTLQEVYEFIKPTDMTMNVELKTGIVLYDGIEEKTAELTAKMGLEDKVIFSSFNHFSAMKIKKLLPSCKVGLLFADGFIDVPDYCLRTGADALHPGLHILQIPGFTEECKRKNIPLHVWTVDKEEHIRLLADSGIEAIITNRPDLARSVVDSL